MKYCSDCKKWYDECEARGSKLRLFEAMGLTGRKQAKASRKLTRFIAKNCQNYSPEDWT